MKIKPDTCSTRVFADLIGRTIRQVQLLISDGVLSKDAKGQVKLHDSLLSYIKHLQDALRHGGSENGEIARARARYEIARAEEKELELATKLGDVVLAEEVQEAWETAASNWRAKLLALPSKIATRTSTMTDRHDIEEVVTEMVESTLTEIAIYGTAEKNTKRKKTKAPDKRSRAKAKAPAKAKRK